MEEKEINEEYLFVVDIDSKEVIKKGKISLCDEFKRKLVKRICDTMIYIFPQSDKN